MVIVGMSTRPLLPPRVRRIRRRRRRDRLGASPIPGAPDTASQPPRTVPS